MTKAHPIPSVKPVIATQQSPYFYFRSFAEDLAWFILCWIIRLSTIATLLRIENPVIVKVVAPARTNNFCQLDEIDLRKIKPKWFERSVNKGILDTIALKKFMIGFLRRILSRICTVN